MEYEQRAPNLYLKEKLVAALENEEKKAVALLTTARQERQSSEALISSANPPGLVTLRTKRLAFFQPQGVHDLMNQKADNSPINNQIN